MPSLTSGSERLIQSFTRRLGYLHDSPVAVEIVSDWLKPDGWLGETNCNFRSFGLSVFKNIAPIIPEAVLLMLERAAGNNGEKLSSFGYDGQCHVFIDLLQNLAYEPELFERSARLLCKYALLERPDNRDGGSARSTLETLFHFILSGTHAPLQLRANIINELVKSDIRDEANLGIKLLGAALQTDNFSINNIGNFGARSRDYGYRPRSDQEICNWFERFVEICTDVALSDELVSKEAKLVLANNLRGLWGVGINYGQSVLERLEDSAARIHKKRAWNDGWVAVKAILCYGSERMPPKNLDRIKQIEKSLRPVSLLERARTYALTGRRLNFDLEDVYGASDDIPSQWEQLQRITRKTGAEVVQDTNAFETILPELFLDIDNSRLWSFGAGLADGCKDRQQVWKMLHAQLEKAPPKQPQFDVLLGFLFSSAAHDPTVYNTILDGLINDPLLGEWFPTFQLTSTINSSGIERLHKSLDSNKVNINGFRNLAYGRSHEPIDDDCLASLVDKICTKEGGIFVAIEILSARFHELNGKPRNYSLKLIGVGLDVVS